jgi:hypothetical protein
MFVFGIASCYSPQEREKTVRKEIHIPDSLKNYYAKVEYDYYKKIKVTSQQLKLVSLEKATSDLEIRVWSLHFNFDPQSICILKKEGDSYILSSFKFYLGQQNWESGKIDSVVKNKQVKLSISDFQNLKLDSIWKLPTQSEMPNGESFGCVDGSDVIIEMSNKSMYKYLFYRCPFILRDRDPIFEMINSFQGQIGSLLK